MRLRGLNEVPGSWASIVAKPGSLADQPYPKKVIQSVRPGMKAINRLIANPP